MIENQTKCSLDTLRSKMGLYVLPITKKYQRYFILTRTNDEKKAVPYYYIMVAQAKRNPRVKVPSNGVVEMYQMYDYAVCAADGNMWE